MRVRTRTLGALLIVGALLLPSAPTAVTAAACWDYRSSERSMARKINNARKVHDREALNLDAQLSKVARSHTKKMARRDGLFHNPRLGSQVTRWTSLGENVGFGTSVANLHGMFMDSTVHRANILEREYRHVGVGVVNDGGTMWVTVVFEARRNPGTTLNMPNC